MYPGALVAEALELGRGGLNATEIARLTGLQRRTVSDWLAGKLPHSYASNGSVGVCERCLGNAHEFDGLPREYVHLLGLYLGDGCISRHPRDGYRLRVTLDLRYPGIAGECGRAMRIVVPKSKVQILIRRDNCFEIGSFSKAWPCLFPQHGPGKKHERPIYLADWQQRLAAREPGLLLRGLIHSDGCRFRNTGRGGWVCPRYAFYNVSNDIKGIFCWACDLLDLHWTRSGLNTIYVSRKADVARMDEFIGPKR